MTKMTVIVIKKAIGMTKKIQTMVQKMETLTWKWMMEGGVKKINLVK